jgi:hypothetical protein
MTDNVKGCLIVQFTHRGKDVTATASYKGYAAAWLKAHPRTSRSRGTRADDEKKALKQAEISVCSILRDWIKGQVMAVECGMLSFENAFLGQILLPSGKTVFQTVKDKELLRIEGES